MSDLGHQMCTRMKAIDSAYRKIIKKQNEQVAKNRYISFISYLIGCIIFCGTLELALCGHREGDDSLNSGIFKGLVNFSAQLDNVFERTFD